MTKRKGAGLSPISISWGLQQAKNLGFSHLAIFDEGNKKNSKLWYSMKRDKEKKNLKGLIDKIKKEVEKEGKFLNLLHRFD